MEQIINNNNDEIIKPHEQPFLDDITKNGRFILSIGSKGSGKTYLMMAVLKYCLQHNIYDAIHFVCPSYDGEQNGSYNFIENQKHVQIYQHYNETVSKKVDVSRRKKTTLFLLDDASGELLSNIDNTLCQLITTTRHFKGCTIYLCVHSCKKILTPLIRQNIDHLFIYKIINMKLLNDLYDEYFSQFNDKFRDFKSNYLIWTKQKYSCIHFSMHDDGIDIDVKNWNILKNQIEKFKPTNAIKTIIKKTNETPNNNSLRFIFSKRRY